LLLRRRQSPRRHHDVLAARARLRGHRRCRAVIPDLSGSVRCVRQHSRHPVEPVRPYRAAVSAARTRSRRIAWHDLVAVVARSQHMKSKPLVLLAGTLLGATLWAAAPSSSLAQPINSSLLTCQPVQAPQSDVIHSGSGVATGLTVT